MLPYDYHETETIYPVLYLNDGQNLFNEHAPFGNWAIDKALSRLAAQGLKDLIVITIDHGEEERLAEYLPYKSTKYGEGKGQQYLAFIIETLKPYVDRKFRVSKKATDTGIGGSSMGGLISLYAGLKHPEVFGNMMVFSPSLWISKEIFKDAQSFTALQQTYLYLYAGGKESVVHMPNIRKLKDALFKNRLDQGKMHFEFSHNPEGMHSESFWRAEFPKAIEWLYFKKVLK